MDNLHFRYVRKLNVCKHIILWTSDTICHRIPFKNTFYKNVYSDSNVFCQYYPEVFCDLTLKIKFNLKRSPLKIIIVYSLVCPVFDRLDFQTDKIYVFKSL